jgi:hypothetical protein
MHTWASTRRWRPCRRSFRLACSAWTAPFACFVARRSRTSWCTGLALSPRTSSRAGWTTKYRSASASLSILKANREVEAAIQLAHDLDETGMPCVCIGVGLLGVLLDLPASERVWSIVQTLHTRTKLCKVCMSDNCRLCTLGSSVHSAPNAHFFRKSMQSLHKLCRVCTCSAPSLQINRPFVWEKQPVDKNADLMHTVTVCRHVQTWCRHDEE